MSDLDAVIPAKFGQLMVDVMPNATTRTWRNAGHYAFVDRECWKEFWGVLIKK